MRIYDQGVLHHRDIRTNDLGITVKTDIGDFTLNTNWLFKENVSLLLYPLQRLKGIQQNFVAMYKKDDSEPFKVDLSYPKVGGGHLNTIKESNALADYLKSLLQTKFDTRMLIIILAVIGMLGVYFLYSQGYIDLSSIRGLIGK